MYQPRNEFKSKTLSIFLVFSFILLCWVSIGVFISGPYFKHEAKSNKIEDKISENHKKVDSIYRNAFAFVTYTLETNKAVFVYDEKGELLLSRDKESLQYKEVEEFIQNTYPELQNVDIQISYGYDNAVYYIEKDYEILLLDYDTLEEVFYMKEESNAIV